MTGADLEAIEKALGFSLPGFYKRFVLAYPPSLFQVKPKTFKQPIVEWEFADNPKRIIEWNLHVRRQKEGTYVDGPWPEEYFVIGHEYGGNYYVINRSNGKETVDLWLHDTGEFSPCGESLPEFVDWLIDYFWQFNDEEEQGDTDRVAAQIKEELARVADEQRQMP